LPCSVDSKPSSRRLFFALWPTREEQQHIETLMRSHVLASGGRAVPAHNLHVTLAFLGQVSEPKLAAAISCADRVGRCGHIDLRFDRVEVWKRSGVLSLTTQDICAALVQVVERLEFNLLSEQFQIRQEHYRPHVTVARDAKKRISATLEEPILWSTERFALVQSETTPAGSRYSVLHNW
jgi:2'-5' RNA ligase